VTFAVLHHVEHLMAAGVHIDAGQKIILNP
jgi:hypothetical protein